MENLVDEIAAEVKISNAHKSVLSFRIQVRNDNILIKLHACLQTIKYR